MSLWRDKESEQEGLPRPAPPHPRNASLRLDPGRAVPRRALRRSPPRFVCTLVLPGWCPAGRGG